MQIIFVEIEGGSFEHFVDGFVDFDLIYEASGYLRLRKLSWLLLAVGRVLDHYLFYELFHYPFELEIFTFLGIGLICCKFFDWFLSNWLFSN